MWVRLDDQAPNDEDIDALSDGAFRLWISAMCYAQAEQTDGYVTLQKLRRLVPNYKASQLRELTAPSLRPGKPPIFVQLDDGITIRNFTKYNRTRDYWEAKRRRDADRIAKWRSERDSEDDC